MNVSTVKYNGQLKFKPGDTPLGYYDKDVKFAQDADLVAKNCYVRLGWPLVAVELTPSQVYACFENAVTVYGNEVFMYKIRESYLSLEGQDNSSGDLRDSLINNSLTRVMQIADEYGKHADVRGNIDIHRGLLKLKVNQQTYDLSNWLKENNIKDGISIRKIFYKLPPAITRYFDPFASTGTGMHNLIDSFGLGGQSPAIHFLLMPASFDLLRAQAIEFNDQFRRSQHSFKIRGNTLQIFPVPRKDMQLMFEYFLNSDLNKDAFMDGGNKVTNVMNIPCSNPIYSKINSVGRQWVFDYTLALTKETLGLVRGKYAKTPIPGSDTSLNQDTLINQGKEERTALITFLRESLEATSRVKQLEMKAQETEQTRATLSGTPILPFYQG